MKIEDALKIDQVESWKVVKLKIEPFYIANQDKSAKSSLQL